MFKLFVLVLLSVSVSIKGPETAKPNDVITLEPSIEDAKNSKWLVPDTVQKILGEDGRLHLVPSEKTGVFTVTLIAVGEDYTIANASHTIKVEEK